MTIYKKTITFFYLLYIVQQNWKLHDIKTSANTTDRQTEALTDGQTDGHTGGPNISTWHIST